MTAAIAAHGQSNIRHAYRTTDRSQEETSNHIASYSNTAPIVTPWRNPSSDALQIANDRLSGENSRLMRELQDWRNAYAHCSHVLSRCKMERDEVFDQLQQLRKQHAEAVARELNKPLSLDMLAARDREISVLRRKLHNAVNSSRRIAKGYNMKVEEE